MSSRMEIEWQGHTKNTPKMKERKKTLSEECEFVLHFIRACKRASAVDTMVGISQTRTHMWALIN